MNLISHTTQDIGAGQVGVSYRDGKIVVRIMTQDEKTDLDNSQLNQGNGNEQQDIELNFKDNQGQQHKLKMKVQKKK